MHYGPLLAGYLFLASQIAMAAEGETAAPPAEAEATTSTAEDGQDTPAPVSVEDYVTSDPDCD